jgi:hypothetical protein
MSKRLPKFFSCPSEFTLEVLGASGKPSSSASSRKDLAVIMRFGALLRH